MYTQAGQSTVTGNATTTAYRTSVPAEPVGGRIGDAMVTQDQVLELLHAELSALEGRIANVLRPVGPPPSAPPGAGTPTAPEPSALAGEIERRNERLEHAIAYVRSLNARVDL